MRRLHKLSIAAKWNQVKAIGSTINQVIHHVSPWVAKAVMVYSTLKTVKDAHDFIKRPVPYIAMVEDKPKRRGIITRKKARIRKRT